MIYQMSTTNIIQVISLENHPFLAVNTIFVRSFDYQLVLWMDDILFPGPCRGGTFG